MDIIQDISLFGKLETNSLKVKDIKTHTLTASDAIYTLNTETHSKHIINLQDAPSSVNITLSGGDDDDFMGVIVLQQSTTTPKTVTWDSVSTTKFDSWTGAVNTFKTYVYHFHDNRYINLAPSSVNRYDLVESKKSFSTTSANTTVSMDKGSYAVLDATLDSAVTFSDLKEGVEYSVVINLTLPSVVLTFPNLILSNGVNAPLGVGKNIYKIIKIDNSSDVYLISHNTRTPPAA